MQPNLRVHITAAGSLLLFGGMILLFWSYPKLLVYLLLAIVAVLAYGALYLILAAWMDPKRARGSGTAKPSSPELSNGPATTEEVTNTDVTPDSARPARKKKTRKRATRKKRPKTET